MGPRWCVAELAGQTVHSNECLAEALASTLDSGMKTPIKATRGLFLSQLGPEREMCEVLIGAEN